MFNITDAALEFLVKFIALFIKLFSEQNWDLTERNLVRNKFPLTLYSLRKILTLNQECFKKYVVCLKCNTLYDHNDCIITFAGQSSTRKCNFVNFPNHKLKHLRKECGQSLMKVVKSASGKEMFIPIKTFCYRSLKQSIQTLLDRPGFELECELWRNESRNPDILTDVFDGEIWKTFSIDNNTLFFF